MSATISRGFALRASIRAATRRSFSRPQLVRASRRAYSSGHPQIPESSHTPWLIGSVVFTVVGLAGILMPGSDQSKASSHTQHAHDPEPVQEATTESEPEQTLEVLEPKPEVEEKSEKSSHEDSHSQPNDTSEAKSVQPDGGSDSEAANTPDNSDNEDAKKDGEKPVPQPEPEAKEEPSKETKAE